jgi:hypothetical protein
MAAGNSATPTPGPKAAIATEILNDLFAAGAFAASIFVKNPSSQQHASAFLQGIGKILAMIEPQL